MNKNWLNYDELSSLIGVKKGTLYQWVHSKTIPHIRISSRMVRFCESDVLAWLEAKRVPPEDSVSSVASERCCITTQSGSTNEVGGSANDETLDDDSEVEYSTMNGGGL